jgi:hypothetical protein
LTALFGPRGLIAAVGAAVAMAVFLLTVWRTSAACVILAVAVPLSAGLGRGTVVPLLRPGEALIVVTLAALAVKHSVLRRQRDAAVRRLDCLVLSFVLVAVCVPAAVLIVNDVEADVAVWMSVLAPAQFLIVYWIFSRSRLTSGEVGLVINAVLLTSVLVAVFGIAQAADLPAVRAFGDAYFPAPPSVAFEEPVYRANSTLEHFSALGAFGVFNFTLAFALHTHRVRGYSTPWLAFVMLVNAGSIVASQTWASAVALPFACLLVCAHARRLPPNLGPMIAVTTLAVVLCWPMISSRFAQQQLFEYGRPVFTLPQTMAFRVQNWQQFFIPSLATDDRFVFGTGTVIPSDVPASLDNFVDNEFIRMAFRAGLPGLAMLVIVQVGIFVDAWRKRGGQGWAQPLGAAVAACVVALVMMELTAEYMGFAGVSQLFWMLVGIFALARTWHLAFPAAEPATRKLPVRVFEARDRAGLRRDLQEAPR